MLGVCVEQSIHRFLGLPPERYKAAEGEAKLEGCLFTVDSETGRCLAAEALRVE